MLVIALTMTDLSLQLDVFFISLTHLVCNLKQSFACVRNLLQIPLFIQRLFRDAALSNEFSFKNGDCHGVIFMALCIGISFRSYSLLQRGSAIL